MAGDQGDDVSPTLCVGGQSGEGEQRDSDVSGPGTRVVERGRSCPGWPTPADQSTGPELRAGHKWVAGSTVSHQPPDTDI